VTDSGQLDPQTEAAVDGLDVSAQLSLPPLTSAGSSIRRNASRQASDDPDDWLAVNLAVLAALPKAEGPGWSVRPNDPTSAAGETTEGRGDS
jgi:hypothetical protein